MYYHVQVSMHDSSQIVSFDNPNLEDVKGKVLAFLLGEDFLLGGSAVRTKQVKTLIVTKTQDESTVCVNLAYSKMPVGSKLVVSPEACVFGNDRFSEDVTESIIAQLKNSPRFRMKYAAIEIWTIGKSPEHLADLLSTVTSLYVTTQDLLDKEVERRYRKFRLKVLFVGLINYAAFIYCLWKFDFHKLVHPVLIVVEVTLHLALVFFLLFGKEYEPREFLKTKKENLRQRVYDEAQFQELDIRKK